MKINEYQAKDLFKEFGITVPQGFLAEDFSTAQKIAKNIGFPCVVKAQVHSGARGKAGGDQQESREKEEGKGRLKRHSKGDFYRA